MAEGRTELVDETLPDSETEARGEPLLVRVIELLAEPHELAEPLTVPLCEAPGAEREAADVRDRVAPVVTVTDAAALTEGCAPLLDARGEAEGDAVPEPVPLLVLEAVDVGTALNVPVAVPVALQLESGEGLARAVLLKEELEVVEALTDAVGVGRTEREALEHAVPNMLLPVAERKDVAVGKFVTDRAGDAETDGELVPTPGLLLAEPVVEREAEGDRVGRALCEALLLADTQAEERGEAEGVTLLLRVTLGRGVREASEPLAPVVIVTEGVPLKGGEKERSAVALSVGSAVAESRLRVGGEVAVGERSGLPLEAGESVALIILPLGAAEAQLVGDVVPLSVPSPTPLLAVGAVDGGALLVMLPEAPSVADSVGGARLEVDGLGEAEPKAEGVGVAETLREAEGQGVAVPPGALAVAPPPKLTVALAPVALGTRAVGETVPVLEGRAGVAEGATVVEAQGDWERDEVAEDEGRGETVVVPQKVGGGEPLPVLLLLRLGERDTQAVGVGEGEREGRGVAETLREGVDDRAEDGEVDGETLALRLPPPPPPLLPLGKGVAEPHAVRVTPPPGLLPLGAALSLMCRLGVTEVLAL